MSPCFNSIKKRLNCMAIGGGISPSGSPTGGITDPSESYDPNTIIRRRRMGVSSTGAIIEMDMWGEPLDKNATDIYNDLLILLYAKKQKTLNDENSNMGGINLYGSKKALELVIVVDRDVMKNDLIEFPVNSNEWYRVHEIDNTKVSFKTIFCLPNLRSRF